MSVLNNSLQNFQGCCLLFNYQGSLSLLFETAYLDYHIHWRLSRTFLIFFRPAFQLFGRYPFVKHSFVSSDSLLRISQAVVFVNCYFILFLNQLLLIQKIIHHLKHQHCCLSTLPLATTKLIYHSSRTLSISFSKPFLFILLIYQPNGERGI